MGKTDQPIDIVVAADSSFMLDGLHLHARHVAEQVANRIQGADLWLFHQIGSFQHPLNIAIQ